jgi:HAD superfamily hydrolase (TIGR01549 family)
LGDCTGALVILPEEARVHPSNVVEVIAPVRLRDALGLEDGAEVAVVSADGVRKHELRVGARLFSLRAVIFDLDGTLLDPRDIYYTIMELLFERLRFPPVSRELLLEASANGEFDWEMVLPVEVRGRSAELQPQIREIIQEISPALFTQKNALIPGVEPLLRRLSSAGMRLGVATSTEARIMEMKLRPLRDSGLTPLIQAVVTADDVRRQKPAPEPLIECATRLGVPPADCLYCGDMRVDIRAGKAAGMVTAAVLSGFDSYATLLAEAPDLMIGSVAELELTSSAAEPQTGC